MSTQHQQYRTSTLSYIQSTDFGTRDVNAASTNSRGQTSRMTYTGRSTQQSTRSGGSSNRGHSYRHINATSNCSNVSTLEFGDSVDTFTPPINEQLHVQVTTRLRQYAHLAFFAMCGCTLRILLQKKSYVVGISSTYSALFGDLIGNIIGTLIIGALTTASAVGCGSRNVALFPNSDWVQKNAELQLGMRTGFCGSLTTFAGWNQSMVDCYLHGSLKSISNAAFGYYLGLFLCLSALPVGESVAVFFCTYVHPDKESDTLSTEIEATAIQGEVQPRVVESIQEENNSTPLIMNVNEEEAMSEVQPYSWLRCEVPVWIMQMAICVLFLVWWITYLTLYIYGMSGKDASFWASKWCPSKRAMIEVVFAPLGAIVRYELSKLNGMRDDFFVGTFAANILAVTILSICNSLVGNKPQSQINIDLYFAVIQGFCGCCSTVSTFITDVIKLMPTQKSELPFRAAIYVTASMALSCSISLLVAYFFHLAE